MTTTDQPDRAPLSTKVLREMARQGASLLAIHDELRRLVGIVDAAASEAPEQTATLRAIHGRLTEPRWIVPDADDDECDRLREERDAARDELARARTQIIALTSDLDKASTESAARLELLRTTEREWDEARDRLARIEALLAEYERMCQPPLASSEGALVRRLRRAMKEARS